MSLVFKGGVSNSTPVLNRFASAEKRSPMKTEILFILDNMQPDDSWGALARIISRLSGESYELYLTCHEDSDFLKAVQNDVEHIPLDFSKKISPGLIFKLAGIIRRKRIRIIHACGARADLYGRLAKMVSGKVRYVSTMPMPAEEDDAGRSRKRRSGLAARFSGRLVDRFIASSDLMVKRMTETGGIRPDRIVKIYNGVDADRLRPDPEGRKRIRAEFNISDDTVLVGAAGRLVWQKGFEFLIKSIPIFIKSHPNAKVVIAGDGPFRGHLMMHSGMIGMSNHLILPGFRHDMKEILSAVDILVIPSLTDEFSMIVLEGMAMAKPIVATRIDGITEQIADGETGLLVLSWDANVLAKAINRLMDDLDLAEGLGRKAREKVEKDFSEEKMISETERLYRSLCNDDY